jgi:hypothetical protein
MLRVSKTCAARKLAGRSLIQLNYLIFAFVTIIMGFSATKIINKRITNALICLFFKIISYVFQLLCIILRTNFITFSRTSTYGFADKHHLGRKLRVHGSFNTSYFSRTYSHIISYIVSRQMVACSTTGAGGWRLSLATGNCGWCTASCVWTLDPVSVPGLRYPHPHALCSMLYALCHMLYAHAPALCSMPQALWPPNLRFWSSSFALPEGFKVLFRA